MDKKIYEKTRYQNIYRHKKNKNYVIMMSKPVKTSISRIDNKKIFDIDQAIKVRDNIEIKNARAVQVLNKDYLDSLWDKYIFACKTIKKQSYNTILRKNRTYEKYLKEKIKSPIAKLDTKFWAEYIDKQQCSNKQKNQILKDTKTFYNWCIEENILSINPIIKIQKYKVVKEEMKYWIPEELKQFLNTLDEAINTCSTLDKKMIAWRTKLLTLICFSLGDRIGETRALTYDNFNERTLKAIINHSINYDRNDNDFLSSTKTYESQRDVDVSKKIIDLVKSYKDFLINDCGYIVKNDDLIFFNYDTNMPYSDVALRKAFYRYIKIANVPKIRIYDLRHTYATLMMAEGKELYTFSSRMGHKNIKTTYSEYGHLTKEVRRNLAEATDKYY